MTPTNRLNKIIDLFLIIIRIIIISFFLPPLSTVGGAEATLTWFNPPLTRRRSVTSSVLGPISVLAAALIPAPQRNRHHEVKNKKVTDEPQSLLLSQVIFGYSLG